MNGPNNKIGWCDYTWNPITGCLGNPESGCYSYCYARRMYERFGWSFKPTFRAERLEEPINVLEPSRIFLCSTSDFWATFVEQEWRDKVFAVIGRCPQHTFLSLTKCPENIPEKVSFPDNFWLGATITKQSEIHRLERHLYRIDAKIFASFEPLLSRIGSFGCLNWVIVGAQTGPNSVKPNPEWVHSIIDMCREGGIPLFLKDNLKWPEKIQEFPKP